MIITDEELFEFFKCKVECCIAQLQKRGIKVGTRSYTLYLHCNDDNTEVWKIDTANYISVHPLSVLLEDQRIVYNEDILDALTRKLGCKEELILAFNKGLSGSVKSYDQYDMANKFNLYGKEVRRNITKR
jgi:hypothetical protein